MNPGMPGGMMGKPPMMGPGPNQSMQSPMQPHQMMAQQQMMPGVSSPMQPQQMPPQMQQQQMLPQMMPHPNQQPPPPPHLPQLVQQPMPPQNQLKDLNGAYVCKLGAEFVEEIITKTFELFQLLKSMNPQMSNQLLDERKMKIKDATKVIELHFKRLRKVYERCTDVCSTIDYVDIESLIAIKDEDDEDDCEGSGKTVDSGKSGENEKKKPTNPKLQMLEKEYQDLFELCQLKNRQMKEIIDRLRKLVWDINTMLAMEK